MARCEDCLHFNLCVNMKHQHLRMLLAGDKAERCNYFQSKADVAPIADTVRKMQERLTLEFDRMHKNNFMTVEVRQWIIDQIAKEILEGKEET